MSEGWYEPVGRDTPLTQGDLLFGCPILTFKRSVEPVDEGQLAASILLVRADVVVITQACDLENANVEDVTLCAHVPLEGHRQRWVAEQQARGQTTGAKAWKSHCKRLQQGFAWNAAMLEATPPLEGVPVDIRVVDFLRVYALPRVFVDSIARRPGVPRLRLRSPYREHLSQSFARFFMRVGLPTGVTPRW